MRPTTVEPAPEEYIPIEWRNRKRPAKTKPKSEASTDGSVNQVETAIGGHTEEALPAAGLLPNRTDLALDDFRLVEVPPFVFDNKDAPVRKHRHKIRIKLVVRELEPERRFLPFGVPNPITNLFVPVEVKRTIELFPAGREVTHEGGVVLGKGPALEGLIGGVGLFIDNNGQVRANGEICGVGCE